MTTNDQPSTEHNGNVICLKFHHHFYRVGIKLIKCDFSLQRHSYCFLSANNEQGEAHGQAKAKGHNSILHHNVGIDEIEVDLKEVGNSLVGILGGYKNTPENFRPEYLHKDIKTKSGRTWRVDHASGDKSQLPNHCYPIGGTEGIWTEVSQEHFAAAAALRRLELAMEKKERCTLLDTWRSLQANPSTKGGGNPLYAAISGARTHIHPLNKSVVEMLSKVSGREQLLKDLDTVRNLSISPAQNT